jgi:hypothetical protein
VTDRVWATYGKCGGARHAYNYHTRRDCRAIKDRSDEELWTGTEAEFKAEFPDDHKMCDYCSGEYTPRCGSMWREVVEFGERQRREGTWTRGRMP